MTAGEWLDDEASAAAALAQLRDLFMAGLRRPIVMLLAGLVCAATLASAVLWKRHSYAPEYVLRIVEVQEPQTGTPPPRKELAAYVRQAIFTSKPLLSILSRHDLYAGLARSNPRAAIESFRADIDVDVRHNYFLQERALGAPPRSVRLVISYRAADADTAVSVTRELGELVVKREQSLREAEAGRAAGMARQQADEARDALALRRSEVASLRADLDREPDIAPERRVAFIGLLGSLPALERLVDERERREASLALGAALEQHGMGISFQLVDDAALPGRAGALTERISTAAVAFILGLPLLVIAVGAFAPERNRS